MNQKHVSSILILVFMFLLAFLGNQQSASASEVNLTSKLVKSQTKFSTLFWNKWIEDYTDEETPFVLKNGEVTTRGFGIHEDYYTGRLIVSFHIGDYNQTTLDTTISLDKEVTFGDLGESEVVIYADNEKIYTKHFTNRTDMEHIKVGIPEGSEELTFYVLQKHGAKGGQSIIFSEPKLTDELPVTPSEDAISLWKLGSAEVSRDVNVNTEGWGSWQDRIPFENTKGVYLARAVGLKPYYKEDARIYTTYNISDYDYTTFETNLSLDNAYRTGDKGQSQIEIYADSERIYTKKLTNTTPDKHLALSIPKGTKYLKIFVIETRGPQGDHHVLLEDPKLTNKNVASKKKNVLQLKDIGIAEQNGYSVHFGTYGNSPMQMMNGQLVSMAYGLIPYYSRNTEVYAKFFIQDYTYKKFKTKISIDKMYSNGNRGKTTVQIYADNKKIYSKVYKNTTKVQNVSVSIPKKTKYLQIKTIHKKGSNNQTHFIILDNPILTN